MPDETADLEKSLVVQQENPLKEMHTAENSGNAYREAVDDIKTLTAGGTDFYPAWFPSWRTPEKMIPVGTTPKNNYDGRITPAEGVASTLLLREHSALQQAFGESNEMVKQIRSVMGLSRDEWPIDVTGGIGDFGNELRTASRVREMMLIGKVSQGYAFGEESDREAYASYSETIPQDGMKLGENTVKRMLEELTKATETDIRLDDSQHPEDMQPRIKSRRHGYELGSKLYLEVLERSSKELPSILQDKAEPSAQTVDTNIVTARDRGALTKVRKLLTSITGRLQQKKQ